MDYQRPNHVATPEEQARVQHSEWQFLKIFVVVVVAIVLVAAISFGMQVNKSMRELTDPRPAAAAPALTSRPAAASASPAPATPAASPSDAAKTVTAAATAAVAAPATASTTAFKPPAADAIPEGPMGDVIRRGEQIFLHTSTQAKAFVGNTLNCVNCHLDAGRAANSAPLWGAYTQYPAYRSKTKSVDTFSERLRGCFMYSMNGKAPPHGDEVLVLLRYTGNSHLRWRAFPLPPGVDVKEGDRVLLDVNACRFTKMESAACVRC